MAKKSFVVQVQPDYPENLARCQPVKALAELFWNTLDADARRIEDTLDRFEGLGGIRSIVISDAPARELRVAGRGRDMVALLGEAEP